MKLMDARAVAAFVRERSALLAAREPLETPFARLRGAAGRQPGAGLRPVPGAPQRGRAGRRGILAAGAGFALPVGDRLDVPPAGASAAEAGGDRAGLRRLLLRRRPCRLA